MILPRSVCQDSILHWPQIGPISGRSGKRWPAVPRSPDIHPTFARRCGQECWQAILGHFWEPILHFNITKTQNDLKEPQVAGFKTPLQEIRFLQFYLSKPSQNWSIRFYGGFLRRNLKLIYFLIFSKKKTQKKLL